MQAEMIHFIGSCIASSIGFRVGPSLWLPYPVPGVGRSPLPPGNQAERDTGQGPVR